ncbi:phosphatase PAP2 family protein [Cohnella cholangitidis]|uniref:Inositol phosphorylceramide synthase n=1 Tax=Cohnella cholangitidis TaxID=2598458 RepID=A0A7G5C3P9_9BACL|nr:phosphatase PAP2 family protein [Cohnella cholangitidis]QMV43833.1 inositol phosphorylceramide synthase [Cohnella cholangitidis]
MVLFHSMSAISISTIVAVSVLIAFGTGRQPFAAAWSFLKTLVVSRKYLLFFVSVMAIMLLNKTELLLENWLKVPYDLTPMLSGWEGGWPAWLQTNFQSPALTAICAIFYLVVFQSAMIASVAIYTHHQNMKLFYAFCIALLLNYFLAVPFYLFVPVNEVWFVHPQVRFLLLDVFPAFEREYRPLSGLNNCFPSLHTSISITIALLASKSGIRRWAIFTWINAAIILFSIFYLGIHWFTDMVAGIALALFSATVGLKIGAWAESRSHIGSSVRAKAKIKASGPIGS